MEPLTLGFLLGGLFVIGLDILGDWRERRRQRKIAKAAIADLDERTGELARRALAESRKALKEAELLTARSRAIGDELRLLRDTGAIEKAVDTIVENLREQGRTEERNAAIQTAARINGGEAIRSSSSYDH